MRKLFFLFTSFVFCFSSLPAGQNDFENDIIKTSKGDLEITFIGHGTLMFKFQDKIIHIDPVSREADYGKLPKADLVLITHEHGDHLDVKVLDLIKKDNTKIIYTKVCSESYNGGQVLKNGDSKTILGIKVEAVPAYNIINKRDNGSPFHPKGNGNGYVLSFGDKRVYVAGDTENTPEMKNLKDINVAFLPMNLPYTMTQEMVVDAAKSFKPKILYPYHFGSTDTNKLLELMKDIKHTEVRIRKM
jgi:L-ascorbate metabolism protein UlaG (beta-lactamase superfamily)